MRSINPTCKLAGLIIVTMMLASARAPVVNVTAFTGCILLMIGAGTSMRTVAIRLMPIMLVAFGLFMTGYRFAAHPDAPGDAGVLLDADAAVVNGLILSTRVLAYAGLGFLFAFTTDKLELVHSMRQQLRLPATYAYALIAAWNLLPDLEREYRRTRHAFRARGLAPLPLSPLILKPMLVKTVLWSQALAVAMESRGFDGNAHRTEWMRPRVQLIDVVFLAVCTAGSVAVLLSLR